MYKPKKPFNVPMKILIPQTGDSLGKKYKKYPKPDEVSDDMLFFGSFITYGGDERDVNGVMSIMDTANIETWYRDDIKSDCAIINMNTGAIYEIENEPEDIESRHIYMKFKCIRYKGGI